MTRNTLSASMLAAILAACGGTSDASGDTTANQADEHYEGHHEGHEAHAGQGEDHEALPPALHEFHESFAPVWHGEPGESRAVAGCDNAARFQELAGPVTGLFEGESTPGTALVDATAALAELCGQGPATDSVDAIEQALTDVHHRFHEAMEASGPAE